MQANIKINPYRYQLYIDDSPKFERLSEHWTDVLKRAIFWRDYCTRPYKKIEILNVFTGKRFSLDDCIKRAEAFRKLHNMQ